jgi:hypothetical protein
MLSEARGTAVASAMPAESLHLPLVLDAADPNMVGKGSLDRLFRDIQPRLARGERITSLTFDTLPGHDYYVTFAIEEYLKAVRPSVSRLPLRRVPRARPLRRLAAGQSLRGAVPAAG